MVCACKSVRLGQLLMAILKPVKRCLFLLRDGDFEKCSTTTTWTSDMFDFGAVGKCRVGEVNRVNGKPNTPTLDHTSGDQVLCDSLAECDKDADRIVSNSICGKSWITIRVKFTAEEN